MSARTGERVRALEVGLEATRATLKETVGTLSALATAQAKHDVHIGLLMKCVYGIVGVALLTVFSAVFDRVIVRYDRAASQSAAAQATQALTREAHRGR